MTAEEKLETIKLYIKTVMARNPVQEPEDGDFFSLEDAESKGNADAIESVGGAILNIIES